MIRRTLSTFLPTLALVGASVALAPGAWSERAADRPGDTGPGGSAERPVAADLAGTVGFVDMDVLREAYPGTKVRENALRTMIEGFNARMDQLQKEVNQAAGDIEAFQEGTEERANAQLMLSLKRLEAEETAKMLEAKNNQEKLRLGVELYAELEQGIADFAAKRGMQLVFRTFSGSANPRNQFEENRAKDVVYHQPALDVTKAVAAHLKTWKPQ